MEFSDFPCLFLLFIVFIPPVLADAAIEMQEGSIEHWIEHYERERRFYRGETDIDNSKNKSSDSTQNYTEGK